MQSKNIIIRMPNWLGDMVMATPVIQDIRTAFPNARITAMAPSSLAPLLTGNPHLDEIFAFTKSNAFLRKENKDIVRKIQLGHYDLGLLLTNSFSSAWWFWRGSVKQRIGFAQEMRGIFLTNSIKTPPQKNKEHLVITYKRLLAPLGISLSNTSPSLYITEEEKKWVNGFLDELKIPKGYQIIGVNAGAAFGPAKCWLPERFSQAAKKMLEKEQRALLFFGDRASCDLIKKITENLGPFAFNLAGRTNLRQLLTLIERCNAFLTNDSGPMHIAAALKTPLVALFGSTNEVATGPFEHGKVIHKRVECSPCYQRVCPIDFRCMKKIEVDEVVKEVEELLDV